MQRWRRSCRSPQSVVDVSERREPLKRDRMPAFGVPFPRVVIELGALIQTPLGITLGDLFLGRVASRDGAEHCRIPFGLLFEFDVGGGAGGGDLKPLGRFVDV